MKPFSFLFALLVSTPVLAGFSMPKLKVENSNLRHDIVYKGRPVTNGSSIRKATYHIVNLPIQITSEEDLKTAGMCSATLIDSDILLTAGHCLPAIPNLRTYVRHVPNPNKPKEFDLIPVVQAVRHPSYTQKKNAQGGDEVRGDIALLRVASPIPGGVPALLPAMGAKLAKDQKVVMAGYGMNGNDAGPTKEELAKDPTFMTLMGNVQNAQLSMADRHYSLLKAYAYLMEKPLLGEEVEANLAPKLDGGLPALFTFDSKHTCGGDSGGPSFLRTSSGLMVIGVHSLSADQDCDGRLESMWLFFLRSIPAYDTYVPNYVDWIKSTMQELHAGEDA